jgi:alanine racemase
MAAAGLAPLPRTAWLEIDLGRLAANLAILRRALPARTRLDVVLKADAYGHGAIPIGQALESGMGAFGGVGTAGQPSPDGLAVATFDEAVELREAGLRLPILVLFPIPPEHVAEAGRRRIALTIGDPILLDRTLASIEAARSSSRAAGRRHAPHQLELHLELETGLGRTGIPLDEASVVAGRIAASPGVRLGGIWSHLQAPADRLRTADQAGRFAAAIELLGADGVRIARRHLSASGGLLSGNGPTLDGVRIGLALYGLPPDDLPAEALQGSLAGELLPVLSLHARPIRVAELPAGSGISYGPSYTTGRPSRIATLPVGYGDGWARASSNRAEALVRGIRVPLVGTVAMDAVMADVTDVPGPAVTVDDEFVLIGEQAGERISVLDVARARTTISWEVVTSMARRLPRVYHAGLVPLSVRTLAGWRVRGSDSALERGYLRPGGRRDRQPGEPQPVDGDGRRRSDQAGRR